MSTLSLLMFRTNDPNSSAWGTNLDPSLSEQTGVDTHDAEVLGCSGENCAERWRCSSISVFCNVSENGVVDVSDAGGVVSVCAGVENLEHSLQKAGKLVPLRSQTAGAAGGDATASRKRQRSMTSCRGHGFAARRSDQEDTPKLRTAPLLKADVREDTEEPPGVDGTVEARALGEKTKLRRDPCMVPTGSVQGVVAPSQWRGPGSLARSSRRSDATLFHCRFGTSLSTVHGNSSLLAQDRRSCSEKPAAGRPHRWQHINSSNKRTSAALSHPSRAASRASALVSRCKARCFQASAQ